VRYWEKALKKIEGDIVKLESRQAEINEKLSTEDFSSNPNALKSLIDEQTEIQTELEAKLGRWEELGTLLGN
jgi:hypothetical protein